MAPVSVYATGSTGRKISEEDLFFYGENGIYYYNSHSSGGCAPGSYVGGPIAISGSTVKEKIWSGLTSFLTAEQAAGVMGNMQSESNFNPAQHEIELLNQKQPGFDLGANDDVSYGLGLVQWSGGRRVGMYNYVAEKNASLLSYFNDYQKYSPGYTVDGEKFLELAGEEATDALLSLELQYLKDELENGYRALFETSTVTEATDYFLRTFERPLDPEATAQTRLSQAEKIYEEFTGSSAGGGSCLTGSGELEEFVRKYVWPDYRKVEGVNYTNRMPDYAEAVGRRISEGKYVGGSVEGVAGIDCGGFVTTIMQESGYYVNYNGCGSNVATQEYWLREGGGSADWEWLNPDGRNMDASDLQLGDVAFKGNYTGGCVAGGDHTFMFIGHLDGFQTQIASASYTTGTNGRAPMSGHESVSGVRWYRKVR